MALLATSFRNWHYISSIWDRRKVREFGMGPLKEAWVMTLMLCPLLHVLRHMFLFENNHQNYIHRSAREQRLWCIFKRFKCFWGHINSRISSYISYLEWSGGSIRYFCTGSHFSGGSSAVPRISHCLKKYAYSSWLIDTQLPRIFLTGSPGQLWDGGMCVRARPPIARQG